MGAYAKAFGEWARATLQARGRTNAAALVDAWEHMTNTPYVGDVDWDAVDDLAQRYNHELDTASASGAMAAAQAARATTDEGREFANEFLLAARRRYAEILQEASRRF